MEPTDLIATLDRVADYIDDPRGDGAYAQYLAAREEIIKLQVLAKELAEALDGVKVKKIAPFVIKLVGRDRVRMALIMAHKAGLL